MPILTKWLSMCSPSCISFYFHADSLTTIPALSTEGHIRFAELALGKGRVDRDDFYASLHQEKLESEAKSHGTSLNQQVNCRDVSGTEDASETEEVTSEFYHPSEGTSTGEGQSESPSWYEDGEVPQAIGNDVEIEAAQDDEVETLIDDLHAVFDDMCERIQCKDPQFNSGFQTFCA